MRHSRTSSKIRLKPIPDGIPGNCEGVAVIVEEQLAEQVVAVAVVEPEALRAAPVAVEAALGD